MTWRIPSQPVIRQILLRDGRIAVTYAAQRGEMDHALAAGQIRNAAKSLRLRVTTHREPIGNNEWQLTASVVADEQEGAA